jgi:hypothetical protein
VNDINYKLFVWWNDYGNSEDQNEFMGHIERKVRRPAGILQWYKRVAPEATSCIHETLSAFERVSKLRWYFERDVPFNDDEGVWSDHPNVT